jgi:hypothetical protein
VLTGALATHPASAVGAAKSLIAASAESDSATSFRLEGVVQQVLMNQPELAANFPRALEWIRARMAQPR